MSRLRLRFVQSFVDRNSGVVFHYFRRIGYPRVRLPGLPGSAEFMAAYELALSAAKPPIGAERTKPGSLDDALSRYYASGDFRHLKAGTQVVRRAILERLRNEHGQHPMRLMPPEFINRELDKMTPYPARNWLNTMRHLMRYCVKHKLCASDPTSGIKLKPIKSDGHHSWTDDEIAAYEAAHPVGTDARLAFALGLYTAQRRGDVIRMGRQHLAGNPATLSVKQEKTGVLLKIPVHPELAETLRIHESQGRLTFLLTKTGKPYRGSDFSQQFRTWCKAAGLPKHCVFHGLRKAALTRLAQAGCTVHEIAAISGHKTLSEVQRYTSAVEQTHLARDAMARIVNVAVKSYPDELSKPLTKQTKFTSK